VFVNSKPVDSTPSGLQSKTSLRLAVGLLLLVVAVATTWLTIDGLSSRRRLRTELAEISHVRYGLLNAARWVEKIAPILDAKIDALDLKATAQANLRPVVENALYRLLDDVKVKASANDSPGSGLDGLLGQANALMATAILGTLRPHVPEYADVVLSEVGRPENKAALKKYVKGVLADGARNTFGTVDTAWYSRILERYGCGSDAGRCQQELGRRIRDEDVKIAYYDLAVLVSSAVAFLVLIAGTPVLRQPAVVVLLLFCAVLLVGGVSTPMIEVEAKITRLDMTFLGQPIGFSDQVLYFQSKSVVEVFQTLISQGRPDMWFVGVLVLMFSVIFPTLKIVTLGSCLHNPALLERNRVVRFLGLESSKWSMADVMVLAIFMSFVAFNGLVASAMGGLKGTGIQLAIPTDSSKILPGYHLFLGFCMASLLLSHKLESGMKIMRNEASLSPNS
jgi:hypothetical protein